MRPTFVIATASEAWREAIQLVAAAQGNDNVKVIGAGFGRTGTRALKAALERLGYGPCYHMSEVIDQPYRIRQWLAIGEGATPNWDEIFAGYQAAMGLPGEPVAPTSLSGAHANRNSYAPSADGSSRSRFSKL